jgi:hypothetical protein
MRRIENYKCPEVKDWELRQDISLGILIYIGRVSIGVEWQSSCGV